MLLRAISLEPEHQIIIRNLMHTHTQTLKSVSTYIILTYDTPSRNIIVGINDLHWFLSPINVIG